MNRRVAGPACAWERWVTTRNCTSLDVLAAEEQAKNDQLDILCDFKASVVRWEDWRYQVSSPSFLEWHSQRQIRNEAQCLQNVRRKLSRYEKLKEKCGRIVEEQIRTAVIEKAQKQSAVTTKARMVFDTSVKPCPLANSLDLLDRECPLINFLETWRGHICR